MPAVANTSTTSNEIQHTLFGIKDEKVLGPDDYRIKFYKQAWEVIGTYLMATTAKFYTSIRLLKKWNHMLVTLIPKSTKLARVADYREISYSSVFYKVIAMVLVGHLADFVGYILHPSQAAFVQGQSITKNIHLAQRIFQKYAQKSICLRCILKVDLQKAFNSVH